MSAELIFAQYRGKRILLDANLLLLYLVGTLQRERIATFKRTSQFSPEDFDLLLALVAQFRLLVTTPHLLTEVNSLANSLPEYLKPGWCDHFGRKIAPFQPASIIMRQTAFNPFGLTDAAIQNASADTLILTEDFRLSGFLQSQGVATLNFRDLATSL
jgi:hypothetical protein